MDFFFKTVFTVFGQDVSWAELIGDLTGLLSVWWVARQNIWTWPIGLVNNVFFFALFADARLFGNSVLQIVFFAQGAYGWWQWHRGRTLGDDAIVAELPVRRPRRPEWIGLAIATAVFWPAAWLFLDRYLDSSAPLLDSLTLALSLVATYMQAKKLLDSWWLFIVVDVVSVPLFWSQRLRLTAGLYLVFMGMCVVGLRDWRRSFAFGDPALGISGDLLDRIVESEQRHPSGHATGHAPGHSNAA